MIVEVTGYGGCCQYCKRFLCMTDQDFKQYTYRIHKYTPAKIFSTPGKCKSSIVQNVGKYRNWIYDKNNEYKLTCPTCIKILVEKGEMEEPEKDQWGTYKFR